MLKISIVTLLSTLISLGQNKQIDSEARARQFLEFVSKQDAASAAALLDKQMNASLPADRLQQLWPGIVKQMGEFKRFGDARVEPFDAAYVVYVTCEFEKYTLDARVPINKEGLVSGFNLGAHADYTPPDYVKTASFHEKDVMVGSGAWALHATLTVPNGTGPFPALILVHGSGPYDRDYTLGPNKIFRDIAWGVASRGVAVLRYNKRTFEHPIPFSKLESPTVKEESVDDALLAAVLLRGHAGD